MLTQRDRDVREATGLIPPDRLRALRHALTADCRDARAAAASCDDPNGQFAASLRGKAIAYGEAARMVQHILDDQALHPRSWSTARRLAREYGMRRAQRKEPQ